MGVGRADRARSARPLVEHAHARRAGDDAQHAVVRLAHVAERELAARIKRESAAYAAAEAELAPRRVRAHRARRERAERARAHDLRQRVSHA